MIFRLKMKMHTGMKYGAGIKKEWNSNASIANYTNWCAGAVTTDSVTYWDVPSRCWGTQWYYQGSNNTRPFLHNFVCEVSVDENLCGIVNLPNINQAQHEVASDRLSAE